MNYTEENQKRLSEIARRAASLPVEQEKRGTSDERRRDEIIASPFPEQYCKECDAASGFFMSAKRRAIGARPKGPNKDSSLLTAQELARIKNMIPEHIEHLDNCQANQGGFEID